MTSSSRSTRVQKLLFNLPIAVFVLVATAYSSAASAGGATAPAGAIGSPARVSPARRINSPAATRSSTDNRSAIVESNLRSINRSLDANRPASPVLPKPSPCPSCGERVTVPPRNQARTDSDATLRSSLHKLRRETNIEQSTDPRRARIEASQPD